MPIVLPASTTWAPTPTNKSLADLKRLVANYVLLTDDADALQLADEALQAGVRKLNTRMWSWARTSQDITLVANDGTYTLNVAFKAPISAMLLDSSSRVKRRLPWETPEILDRLDTSRATSGTSNWYTIFNAREDGIVNLIDPPSSSFVTTYPTLRLRFYKRIGYVAGGDKLDAPSEVEEFLVWYARSEMAAIHNMSKADRAERQWRDLWRALVRDQQEIEHTDWVTYTHSNARYA